MLTKILRDRPDVANRLAALVAYTPKSWLEDPISMLAPPCTENYATVGTAFDYLLRWGFEARNPNAKDQPWIAEVAVAKLANTPDAVSAEVFGHYTYVLENARLAYRAYLADPTNPDRLDSAAKFALCLARIDPYYRSGTVDPTPHLFDADDLVDMQALHTIVPWDALIPEGSIPFLNPSFGSVSTRFDGADADLIVGSRDGSAQLIDFKASKYNDITKHFPQLVGYGMIVDLYRIEAPLFPRIDSAGIYFARHGYVETFDFRSVRAHPDYKGAMLALLEAADRATGRIPGGTWMGPMASLAR